MQSADKQPNEDRKKKKDSLEEKIHRHLTDPNDRITDEDIRNVVVGTPDGDPTEDEASLSDKAGNIEQKIPKGTKGTPWDTLSDD